MCSCIAHSECAYYTPLCVFNGEISHNLTLICVMNKPIIIKLQTCMGGYSVVQGCYVVHSYTILYHVHIRASDNNVRYVLGYMCLHSNSPGSCE